MNKNIEKKTDNIKKFEYKDITNLKTYLSESGKIMPKRITGLNSKNQRKMSKIIKFSRYLSLLPYCDQHKV
jgi:small subunit ribosomal protein S18